MSVQNHCSKVELTLKKSNEYKIVKHLSVI